MAVSARLKNVVERGKKSVLRHGAEIFLKLTPSLRARPRERKGVRCIERPCRGKGKGKTWVNVCKKGGTSAGYRGKKER